MRRTSILPAILMGLSLGVLGCADATTRDDVADAREDLREEQQDTQEAMREGQEEIADARQDGQPYTANRPVMDEDVAEARQEAQEEVAEERRMNSKRRPIFAAHSNNFKRRRPAMHLLKTLRPS